MAASSASVGPPLVVAADFSSIHPPAFALPPTGQAGAGELPVGSTYRAIATNKPADRDPLADHTEEYQMKVCQDRHQIVHHHRQLAAHTCQPESIRIKKEPASGSKHQVAAQQPRKAVAFEGPRSNSLADEFNGIRERLFRLLSKVPIQVESERSVAGSSKQLPPGPLLIKYYHERTLADLLELHFACSLVKSEQTGNNWLSNGSQAYPAQAELGENERKPQHQFWPQPDHVGSLFNPVGWSDEHMAAQERVYMHEKPTTPAGTLRQDQQTNNVLVKDNKQRQVTCASRRSRRPSQNGQRRALSKTAYLQHCYQQQQQQQPADYGVGGPQMGAVHEQPTYRSYSESLNYQNLTSYTFQPDYAGQSALSFACQEPNADHQQTGYQAWSSQEVAGPETSHLMIEQQQPQVEPSGLYLSAGPSLVYAQGPSSGSSSSTSSSLSRAQPMPDLCPPFAEFRFESNPHHYYMHSNQVSSSTCIQTHPSLSELNGQPADHFADMGALICEQPIPMHLVDQVHQQALQQQPIQCQFSVGGQQ